MRKKIKKNHEFFELSKFRRRFMLLVLLTLFFILFSRAFFLQGMQKDFCNKKVLKEAIVILNFMLIEGKFMIEIIKY